jgi:hypothetical protein
VTDATSRTLRNELWRSLPSGVIDTLTATFGMLIAVRVFHMGDAAKSLFLSATSGGMVASLFVVPLRRCRSLAGLAWLSQPLFRTILGSTSVV